MAPARDAGLVAFAGFATLAGRVRFAGFFFAGFTGFTGFAGLDGGIAPRTASGALRFAGARPDDVLPDGFLPDGFLPDVLPDFTAIILSTLSTN